MPLYVKIIIGLALGIIWSFVSSMLGWNQFTIDWIDPFGAIFIRLLKFIAVPLVLFSIITGVAGMNDVGRLGKLGGKTSIWDFGVSLKPGLLHTNLVEETLLLDGSGSVISEPLTGNSFFVEPSIFTRVGGEHLKLSIKLGGLYIRNSEGQHLPYFPINLGVGLNFRL